MYDCTQVAGGIHRRDSKPAPPSFRNSALPIPFGYRGSHTAVAPSCYMTPPPPPPPPTHSRPPPASRYGVSTQSVVPGSSAARRIHVTSVCDPRQPSRYEVTVPERQWCWVRIPLVDPLPLQHIQDFTVTNLKAVAIIMTLLTSVLPSKYVRRLELHGNFFFFPVQVLYSPIIL